MEITVNMSENAVLTELGRRIRQRRISIGLTQADLAKICGISSSTETRIENGEDSKMSNYIKILSGMNMKENINILIPEEQPDFKTIYENKKTRQRFKPEKKRVVSGWTWEEDR